MSNRRLQMNHEHIAACFNACFEDAETTKLIGGSNEPLYLPGDGEQMARLYYREDYAASALHEIAHWCIAGRDRRRSEDFGYQYTPPPRTAQQQEKFFALECRTQALESIFAEAAGLQFRVSADNLAADLSDFAQVVRQMVPQVRHWMLESVDSRARTFAQALAAWHDCETGEAIDG